MLKEGNVIIFEPRFKTLRAVVTQIASDELVKVKLEGDEYWLAINEQEFIIVAQDKPNPVGNAEL